MASRSLRLDHVMSIKGVTLFDNGYAVFQREATVQGHGSIDLYFSQEHMNSVLETLQFLGDGGKKVGNIAYEATKPVPSIELQNENPLVNLLRSLMGRCIAITYGKGDGEVCTEEGKVLGVDEWRFSSCATKIQHVSILIEGGCMQTIPMESIRNFRILESQVQEDIAFSLDLRHSSDSNLQKLSVFYSDVEDPATLIARYGFRVTEWKSSYRMKLSDHPTNFKLDGLAIVENSLDEDWNDI